MFPPKGSGLEQIRKYLSSERSGFSFPSLNNLPFGKYTTKKPTTNIPFKIPNPMQNLQAIQTSVQSMIRGLSSNLTSALSQFTKKAPSEDYGTIVRSHIPLEARLITPQYPNNSKDILLADVDGDSADEVIASYKSHEGINTIVLKKQNDEWQKYAEIINPNYEDIHYRMVTDITGEGKQQLVLGLKTNDKTRALHGYSIYENKAVKLFERNYHKLEVFGSNKSSPSARFALWNEKSDSTYDVDFLSWNGLQLEPHTNTLRYFQKRVVPYYVRKVRQDPNTASNWYSLADSLKRAGSASEARNIIDMGMERDFKSELKERFIELRNTL